MSLETVSQREADLAAEREAAAAEFERLRREGEESRKEALVAAASEHSKELASAKAEAEAAIIRARQEAALEVSSRHEESRVKRAESLASGSVRLLKVGAAVLLVGLLVTTFYFQFFVAPSTTLVVLTALLFIVNLLSVLDMMGISVVRKLFDGVESWLSKRIRELL